MARIFGAFGMAKIFSVFYVLHWLPGGTANAIVACVVFMVFRMCALQFVCFRLTLLTRR